MTRHKHRKRGHLLAVTVAAALAVPAFAAEDDADDDAPRLLEEVLVTATKRSTNLQTTALSVSALTGQQLEDASAADIASFYRLVPGLSILDRGPHQTKTTIRGIENKTHGSYNNNTVGVYVDDIPVTLLPSSQALNLNIYDLERIEVLRGPQGTLYGASSMAGTVKYVTNKPRMNEYEANAQAMLATTDGGDPSYSVETMVNIPLVQDQLAARIVAYYRKDGGYIDKVFPGMEVPGQDPIPELGIAGFDAYTLPSLEEKNANSRELTGMRAMLKWQPTDRLAITGTILYEDSQADDTWASQPQLYGELEDGSTIKYPSFDKNWIYSLVAEYDFGGASFYSSSNYIDREKDLIQAWDNGFPFGLAPPGTELHPMTEAWGFSQEFRLVSQNDSRFNWLVGAWYFKFHDESSNRSRLQIMPELTNWGQVFNTKGEQWALFGEASWDFTDKLTGTFGYRYSDFKQSDGPTITFVEPTAVFFPPYGEDPTITTYEDSVPSMKFDISYQATDNVFLYALASEGVRVGGFNKNILNDPRAPDQFSSDSLWNYELGSKATFMDGTLQLNTTLFYVDWSNMQNKISLSGVTFTGNAGESHIAGLEFETVVNATDRLTFWGSGTFREAMLDEDMVVDPSVATGTEGKEGDRLLNVPNITLSLAGEYRFAGLEQWGGTLRADVNYVSDSYTRFRADPPADPSERARLDDYVLVNLRGRFQPFKNWNAELFVTNLFDTRAEVDILLRADGVETTTYVRPRTIGLQMQYVY